MDKDECASIMMSFTSSVASLPSVSLDAASELANDALMLNESTASMKTVSELEQSLDALLESVQVR